MDCDLYMKKISIIVCAYNEEKFIEQSIRSLLEQTYPEIEIIFVDDGSTDNTVSLVAGFEDKRIRIFHNEKNLGLAASRNKGLHFATGDYIGFFDGDDIAVGNRYQIQVQFLDDNPEIGMVAGAVDFIDKDGRLVHNRNFYLPLKDKDIRGGMLFSNVLPAGGVLFRRELVDKYGIANDPALRISQDYLFWIDMLQYSKVANLDTVLFHYRIGHGSKADKTKHSNIEQWEKMMRGIVGKAWSNVGIVLTKEEFDFMFRFFFKSEDKISFSACCRLFHLYSIICSNPGHNSETELQGQKHQFRIHVMRHLYAGFLQRLKKLG